MTDEQKQNTEGNMTQEEIDQTIKDSEMMAEAMKLATESMGELGTVGAIAGWASHYAAEMYKVQLRILNNELDLIKTIAINELKALNAQINETPETDWADEQKSLAVIDILKASADIKGHAADRAMRFATDVMGQILNHYGPMATSGDISRSAMAAVSNVALVSEMRAYMGDCNCSEDEDDKGESCECHGCSAEREKQTPQS